ncbi:piRNA biogenesis protein EXD1-like [Daphnia pulex]|uniref:piRNA biogenesis protein EXD1-like n=1 Tax=Daphnia pulex TaxID=6669 RepID=UPI001EDFAE1D|nr:piRNA biogenesis protein EXD1-like [Daphnia pulex]XP_046439356.1 piRNA biogenesis protein EXD1-like [Daphnia pulex]
MSCEIGPKIVGCRVVIKTLNSRIEGDVRNVDSNCCKVSLVNGVVVATGAKLPELYRIFVKDIVSITLAGGNDISPENLTPGLSQLSFNSPPCIEKKVKPLLITHIEKKCSSVHLPPPSAPSNDRKIQPLVMQKVLPAHIKTLNNSIQVDVLTNKVPFEKAGEGGLASTLPNYTLIENIDELYKSAIGRLEKESVVGLSMEGVRTGRFGVVCWIGVATSDHVFLFDMCSLGSMGVNHGLANIFTNDRVIKVVHDCRCMSDAFVHQYGVKLNNVFDTQVGALVVDKNKYGAFNRYVPALTRSLTDILNLPSMSMYHPRKRMGHEKEDEAIWKTRPLPQHLIEGAVFNVCWLRKLRLAIMEILLSDVTFGTNLYLKEISELADDSVAEKGVVAHVIPMSFKALHKMSKKGDACEDFHDSVPQNGCDPYVSFTRHISHVRKT